MKREIVLALHRQHVEEKHNPEAMKDVCPMCEHAYKETYNYWVSKLEQNLMPLIKEHESFWDHEGVNVGNVSSPALDILHDILQHWVQLPPVEVSDAPEDYLQHPIVLALYEKELSKK
jgi:hypothetical protein